MKFNNQSTGMPYYDDMIKDKEYYIRAKGVSYIVTEMTPSEYIEACVEGFNLRGFETNREEVLRSRNGQPYLYKELNEKGWDMPILDYKDIFSQEGLNRTMKAMNEGVETMPVMIINRV